MSVYEWIRKMWRDVTLLEILILAVIAGIISAVVVGAGEKQGDDARCLDAGYTQAKRVRGSTYCIRQKDGTDEVIRLDEAPSR